MHPPCSGEASQPCCSGCFPSPFLASYFDNFHNTTKSIINITGSIHDDLEAATSSTLHPYNQFTNHETLPSLDESYINFTKAYPPFCSTSEVDRIRAQEYNHLNLSNICFDYTGYGLFSNAQEQRSCPSTSIASSSSCPPPSLPYSALEPPFFDISYKPINLHSQVLYGGQESELESKIRERIMAFMNISEADYTLVFIANEVSAFKLIGNSFKFQSDGELLTVYDHKSEAVDVMIETCKEQGANILSAEFSWPNLGIRYRKLKKMIMSRRDKRKRGLFVFPLHSRVTGAPYSYIWMSMAQENGWHVLIDACALVPKEMESLGLTMFKPDFMVCSFYKKFGKNPSGFGCLFVKKSSISALKESGNATSIGIVSLFPAFRQPQPQEEIVIADEETEPKSETPPQHVTEEAYVKQKGTLSSEIVELNSSLESVQSKERLGLVNGSSEIECRGLDHADSVGLILISGRGRYLTNWLVNALMSLQHPHTQTGLSLIRIYGPEINLHRGPAVAFNVFDWKGEKIDPTVVQKLADRNNISLSGAFLQNIRFSDKNEEKRQRICEVKGLCQSNKTQSHDFGVSVVTAALGFLTNFEDVYRLWAFLSRFLDADFVDKERLRYMALNQKTLDI
ncbi:molybdenum cofactor sulfurase-like [Gastrolobium bilobum]|uniref:molybdenum cofactor sulfurase-like n=1 Tax=Gastrolobium bilobum TaxID=150636 RepID=UPI002AB169CD|nr:molybdenum cofactor sulfurase-like [Gastrolobium bilobum]